MLYLTSKRVRVFNQQDLPRKIIHSDSIRTAFLGSYMVGRGGTAHGHFQKANPRLETVPSSAADPARVVPLSDLLCEVRARSRWYRLAGIHGPDEFLGTVGNGDRYRQPDCFSNFFKRHFSLGAKAVDDHVYFTRRQVVLK